MLDVARERASEALTEAESDDPPRVRRAMGATGQVTRAEAWGDLALWAAVGACWFAVNAAGLPVAVGIAVVGTGLVAFIVVCARRGRERPRDFGLRVDNVRCAAGPILGVTAVLGAGMVAWAVIAGTPVLSRELAMLLPVYPVWGVAQQLVVQGVVHRRLALLTRSTAASVLLTGLVFGGVHAATPLLGALTAVAGVSWAWLFSRWPNVWLLGLSHGVLAALAYPLLLATNPLAP